MQIYLAGPDVFQPDALQRAESARRLVSRYGHRALIPLDNEASTAAEIYRANLAQIAAADLVIANLNPFR
ncbi:MAG TPA: nucleoside 2-deoxyribosyltransferase, partial [Azonexus sp.]|nr:nucleoside 2-deoxyribosyltransferase [Azonexus sp.]